MHQHFGGKKPAPGFEGHIMRPSPFIGQPGQQWRYENNEQE
jgi:hypothetical protein